MLKKPESNAELNVDSQTELFNPEAVLPAPALPPPGRHPFPTRPRFLPSNLQYVSGPEPIVADSCIVALDMLEFQQSGAFQCTDDGAAA